VNPELIERAKTVEGLTIVIGGGIRTAEQAQVAAQAGADWVVTGTMTEDASDLEELRTRISAVVNALN
jgi:phosphoglycerol geranylgeranyltransferase